MRQSSHFVGSIACALVVPDTALAISLSLLELRPRQQVLHSY
jgi:hypothetical protein